MLAADVYKVRVFLFCVLFFVFWPGVLYAFNPKIREAEAGRSEFETILVYILRLCLKTNYVFI